MPDTKENSNTTDAKPNVADQAPTVVVQVSAEALKQAVHDTIIEMRQNAVASSKSAALDLITLPYRAASDFWHWMKFGDVGGKRGFGRPRCGPRPARPPNRRSSASMASRSRREAPRVLDQGTSMQQRAAGKVRPDCSSGCSAVWCTFDRERSVSGLGWKG